MTPIYYKITLSLFVFMLQAGQNFEIHPIFGLPVTKESRQVEAARSKNSAYNKRLNDHISSLDLELKSRRVRLLSDEATTKDFLDGILSTHGYSVEGRDSVLDKQTTNIKRIRQRKDRSRSLSKFDEKLKEIRDARQTERGKDNGCVSFSGQHLTEYGIKKNLYRSRSVHNLLKECEKHNPAYKITRDQDTVFPLYHRKNIATEAYQRSLSIVEPPLRRIKPKTSNNHLVLANDWFDLSSSWPSTKAFPTNQTRLPSLDYGYRWGNVWALNIIGICVSSSMILLAPETFYKAFKCQTSVLCFMRHLHFVFPAQIIRQ